MTSFENSSQPLTDEQIRARSGEILRRNLIKNKEFPKPDYAAHHIIPLLDSRTRWAREVRRIFDRFFPPKDYQHLPLEEWPINQAFNGVWMRNANYHQLKKKEIPHSKVHDKDYYFELYRRLKDVKSKEDFLKRLSLIKEDIIHNRFWDHNERKLAEIEQYRQKKINEYLEKAPNEKKIDDTLNLYDPETEEKAQSIARILDHTTEDLSTVIARIRREISNKGFVTYEKLSKTAYKPKRKSALTSNNSPLRNKSSKQRPGTYNTRLRHPPNRPPNHFATRKKSSRKLESRDRID